MRLLTIGLLALGLPAGACNRANNAAATASRELETSRTAATTPGAATGIFDRTGWHEVTIPAETRLPIVLDTSIGSDTSTIEEPVHAHLARAVSLHGEPVLLPGSRVSGVVTDAKRSGRVKGRAHVAVRFDTLVPQGVDERYRIHTAAVGPTAPGTKKKDALEIGVPAAGGALIGAIVGGKKGALIGTAVGGGVGTAVVLSTRGKEIHLLKGAALTLRLLEPVSVRVRG